MNPTRLFCAGLKCAASLAVIAISGCATSKTEPAPPPAWSPPSISVDYGDPNFKIEPEEAGQAFRGGFKDYRQVIQAAAAKDRKALARFFYISAHAPFDAAGGEQEQGTMSQMLLRWGDLDFASVLSTQPPKIRANIIWLLKRTSNRFELLFPLTAKAAQAN